MTTELDPVRLVDDESEAPALRAILRAGRDDLPDEDAVARILARVTVTLAGGGGGGGGGGAGGAPAAGAGAPVGASGGGAAAVQGSGLAFASLFGGAVALGGALVLGALVVWPTLSPPPRAVTMLDAAPTPAAEPGVVPVAPRPDVGASTASVSPTSSTGGATPAAGGVLRPAPGAHRIPPASPEPSIVEVDEPAAPVPLVAPVAEPAPDEITLVSDAQRALAAAPREALALADRAAALYPDGALAQEREVVAVSALVALGRTTDARERADRFAARWPRSPHVRRLDVLLAPPP